MAALKPTEAPDLPFVNEVRLRPRHWVVALGGKADAGMKPAALLWALERGSRSGRVAWQFAKDHVGRAAAARSRK